ncbi:MAG: methyltransferase domain-containing protein [Firmicutes bacterium]|nr:methyltransferase domain-containing protein [Bacillota bacterium]
MKEAQIATPVKPSFWDREARGYSLMTLMEVNGTNLQLDAMPITPDMVILDCGCGPGRVAIQAAKRVKKVICLDSSMAMLEECRRNCEAAGITNVEYVYADWQETEIGRTIPEVDMIIQSRGGGGPTTLAMLQKAARRYAVTVMWSDGAPCLPESRGKLFVDCYSEEAMEANPDLRPFRRPAGPRPPQDPDKLPMSGPALKEVLAKQGIEVHVTKVDEGWDKLFASKEEAYSDLINLSRYPELVDMERFRANVDKYLTRTDEGWRFFLPTSSDVAWFKTR